jgi:Predicted membrane protein (DUF2207)
MKSWRARFILIALVLLAGVLPTRAQNERVLNFNSDIVVHADGSMTVTETIRVDAEGQQIKHGIYRDFPQLYRGQWGLRAKTGFVVRNVERDGNQEPYHLENRDNGVRVYIGDKSSMVGWGKHTYVLVYDTDRQLGFFDSHDELYWNATGNGWNFWIDKATVNVTLPPGATPQNLAAYTGAQGERGQDFSAEVLNGKAHFETTRKLGPNEGLTIVVEWPKGFVTQAGPEGKLRWLLLDNKGLAFAVAGLLLVLIYFTVTWAAVGKDPKRGTIIPLYGPPENFSPAAVRYLVRMGFDNLAFTAAILNLAVKGKIKIQEHGKKQYTLYRAATDDAGLLPEEATLMRYLLGRTGRSLELVQTNHSTLQEATKQLSQQLKQKEERIYFVRNWQYWLPGLILSLIPIGVSLMDAREMPVALFMLVWLSGWSVGVTFMLSQLVSLWRSGHWVASIPLTLFALPFLAGEVFGLGMLVYSTSWWVMGIFAVTVFLNGMFYHLMKRPTLAGRKILDQIEGFKMYLSVAEKDRLNLENPPERTPQLFEKFLPYALALGVEQRWSEQFADVLKAAGQGSKEYSPGWYSGNSWATLGAAGFATSLGSSFSSTISSASTSPGSSSGGGGGGSSGGGGGGGGGGGW